MDETTEKFSETQLMKADIWALGRAHFRMHTKVMDFDMKTWLHVGLETIWSNFGTSSNTC